MGRASLKAKTIAAELIARFMGAILPKIFRS
jgi:hypothetical protein